MCVLLMVETGSSLLAKTSAMFPSWAVLLLFSRIKHHPLSLALAFFTSWLTSSFLMREMRLTGRDFCMHACMYARLCDTLCPQRCHNKSFHPLKQDQRWASSCRSGWRFKMWNSWTQYRGKGTLLELYHYSREMLSLKIFQNNSDGLWGLI